MYMPANFDHYNMHTVRVRVVKNQIFTCSPIISVLNSKMKCEHTK